TGLTSVYIPSSVTTIKEYAFGTYTNTIIFYEAETEPFGWNNWWCYNYTGPEQSVIALPGFTYQEYLDAVGTA
ncbi:MAG: hypothetical protein J6U43_03325, partial [Bacteroidales bacterium]|nr:hypothetical protein [Bacteroidales bacterium]